MVKPLIQATGRRKDAVARVRLREVAGEPSVTVNGRDMEDYFPSESHIYLLCMLPVTLWHLYSNHNEQYQNYYFPCLQGGSQPNNLLHVHR